MNSITVAIVVAPNNEPLSLNLPATFSVGTATVATKNDVAIGIVLAIGNLSKELGVDEKDLMEQVQARYRLLGCKRADEQAAG